MSFTFPGYRYDVDRDLELRRWEERQADVAEIEAWMDESLQGWRDLAVCSVTVHEGPVFEYERWDQTLDVAGWHRGPGIIIESGRCTRPFPLAAALRDGPFCPTVRAIEGTEDA